MALNDPRTIPYEFRVFEMYGWAWLYDESERQYPCTATPHIYAEALYPVSEEAVAEFDHYGLYPDEILLSVGRGGLGVEDSLELMGVDFDVEREEAWGDARENACGNCLI